MEYKVKVPDFEGPLDLLLHLIRKNALDIYTISVSEIANKYLEYTELMESLNLDGVGDFLVMAATLAYHKSRMLLPSPAEAEEDEEEFESLEELHRRLIEYQRYKEAAQELRGRDLLNRDVFKVSVLGEVPKPEAHEVPIRTSLFDLLDAFHGLLKTLPKESAHRVVTERIRLVDRIVEVLDLLVEKKSLGLEAVVGENPTREKVVVTFLCILELVRMQLIRAYQFQPFGPIQLRLVSGDVDPKQKLKEGMPHYEP
jgi:segregation and condensation protein A